MTDTGTELTHYGVPGMKWGKRKASSDSTQSSGREAKNSARAERKKKIQGMSDQELRDRINRIKLEKELDKLTSEDTSRGQQVAGRILSGAGNMAVNIGKNVVQQQIARAINEAINNK